MPWICPGKQPEEVIVHLSGPEKQEFDPDNIGFLVKAATGKATNRWADGTAGIPQGATPFIEEAETAYHPETGEECHWVERSHSPAGHVKGSATISEEPKRIAEEIKAEGPGIFQPMRTWTTWFGFKEYQLMANVFSRLKELGHAGWDEVNELLRSDPPGEQATKETLRHAYLTNWQYGGYMYDFVTPSGLPSWGSVSYADPEKVLKLATEGGLKEIHLAGGYWEKFGKKGWGEKVSLDEAEKLLKKARETERLPFSGGHIKRSSPQQSKEQVAEEAVRSMPRGRVLDPEELAHILSVRTGTDVGTPEAREILSELAHKKMGVMTVSGLHVGVKPLEPEAGW